MDLADSTGNNREKSGTEAPLLIKTDRDGVAIDLKLQGRTNEEIAQVTGMNLKTVQNVLSKGGRLYAVLETLRSERSLALRQNNMTAWDKLCAAKEPAIEELKRIAKEDPNAAVRLKAIDMILELTGARDNDKPPLLDPSALSESCTGFLTWANEMLLRMFRERAPKAVLIDRNEHSIDNLILAYGYQLEKYIHWRHCRDQEDVNEWLRACGWDVEKTEALLKELGEPSDPWVWICENPEKAEALREAVEKDRLRRSEFLMLIARTIHRHILLLSESAILDENTQAISSLTELLSAFSDLTKEEIGEYIREIKLGKRS